MKDNSFTPDFWKGKVIDMNREFVNKMMEAKKMEGEAFLMLLPENVRGHVEVIEKEIKAMALECITECLKKEKGQQSASENGKSGVTKVEII